MPGSGAESERGHDGVSGATCDEVRLPVALRHEWMFSLYPRSPRAHRTDPMGAVDSHTVQISTPDAGGSVEPFATMSDLDAIAEVTRGNREMFEVIVRRYNQLLYRVGMAYLRNHAHVEDAMQNAYVKAFTHLEKFERSSAFSTWITRIMINECLMMMRHRRSRPETPFELIAVDGEREFHQPAVVDADRPAADTLNLKEMKALLEEAVTTLPRKYRAVYILREIQQLSTAEVAATLGVSEGSVKVDLHRARERLKAELLKSAAGAELFSYPACFCDPMTTRVLHAIRAI